MKNPQTVWQWAMQISEAEFLLEINKCKGHDYECCVEKYQVGQWTWRSDQGEEW